MTQFTTDPSNELPVCPRHPDRVTYVRCQRCNRPTCPQCQVPSAVGVHCVDCARRAAASRRDVRSVLGGRAVAGEVRPSPRGQERLREALKLGFSRVICPKANAPRKPLAGLEVVAVERIGEALEQAWD